MEYSLADRTAHLAAWTSSGLSQAAYCRKHGISYHVFRHWRDMSKRQAEFPSRLPDAEADFVQLPRPTSTIRIPYASPSAVTILLPQGVQVSTSGTIDTGWLCRLVQGLHPC